MFTLIGILLLLPYLSVEKESIFLQKYYTEITSKEGGKRAKLPNPTIIHRDDDECIIVLSFRYSSKDKSIFQLVQQFVRTNKIGEFTTTTTNSTDEDKTNCIAFWTIPSKDVPAALTNNNSSFKYHKEHGFTIIVIRIKRMVISSFYNVHIRQLI